MIFLPSYVHLYDSVNANSEEFLCSSAEQLLFQFQFVTCFVSFCLEVTDLLHYIVDFF